MWKLDHPYKVMHWYHIDVGVYTYTVVVSLDDFEEESGPVLHWFREDLQEVAIVIKVHQDVQLLQL